MRTRNKRNKRKEIGDWPEDAEEPREVAEKVSYVGSAEHKSYPSPVGHPKLRSDATRCDPELGYDANRFTKVLQTAILRGCVSPVFNGAFPRYVWGWIDDRLFEARLINKGAGTYKAYELDEIEAPKDPEDRLVWTDDGDSDRG